MGKAVFGGRPVSIPTGDKLAAWPHLDILPLIIVSPHLTSDRDHFGAGKGADGGAAGPEPAARRAAGIDYHMPLGGPAHPLGAGPGFGTVCKVGSIQCGHPPKV